MTVEKIHASIAVALKQFAERGWEGEVGMIRPDETAGPTMERLLASKSYDCVVIGAGVAGRPAALPYSKPSSTLFIKPPQARPLPSIQCPMTAPMPLPVGWRLQAQQYETKRSQLRALLRQRKWL